MSLPLLMNLINESCKTGSISSDTKKYLLKKADEYNISADLVEKTLKAKNITIVERKQQSNSTESVLKAVNTPLREMLSKYLEESKYDTIIEYFEEKLFGTIDYVFIDIYLKALICKNDYPKAYAQSEKLKGNIKSDLKNIYPTLGKIYLSVKEYSKAFDVYFVLLDENDSDAQANLDVLVNSVLNDGKFDLLSSCRKNRNYIGLAKVKLSEFYESKKYQLYIKLFEEDFENDQDCVENYIWSLYRNDGTEKKGYEKGKYYISKVENPESLSYVMGLICSYLEKWIEAYDFFKNCLQRKIDVQEDIDKIIDKLVLAKEWEVLSEFKDSVNYNSKAEKAFDTLWDDDDYSNIISVFEYLFPDSEKKKKIKRYVYSLYRTSLSKSLEKYKDFDHLFSKDKYWLWIGGKIYEESKSFETALDLFQKAEAIETGYCSDDVKRVYYIVNPDIHFKDLYSEEKYKDAIDIFESKLNKTADIDIIGSYIWSLYQNDGTEKKGLELGILYSKSNPDGAKLYRAIALICKYLKKYTQAKDYFKKAKSAGYDVDEELQEVNMIIAKAEEEERKRKEEEERKRKEEEERKQKEFERKKEQEIERIRQQEIEDIRNAAQRKKEDRERKERAAEVEEERENEKKAKQTQEDSKIGSHEFKSSITRGGDAVFPEHIYIDDNEVTWEKRKGIFSKDSKTIPIKSITQVDIETSLIGAKIKIRSKGFGFIQGENFTKSDVKEIKSLIEKAQGNI